jgi:hypothetical protein
MTFPFQVNWILGYYLAEMVFRWAVLKIQDRFAEIELVLKEFVSMLSNRRDTSWHPSKMLTPNYGQT